MSRLLARWLRINWTGPLTAGDRRVFVRWFYDRHVISEEALRSRLGFP